MVVWLGECDIVGVGGVVGLVDLLTREVGKWESGFGGGKGKLGC